MKKINSRGKRKLYKTFWNLVVVVFLIFLGTRMLRVDAGMNDSKLEKNRLEGVYAISRFNGEEHLYYLNMYTLNGIVSYCVELGKDITTEWYHSTEDFGISSLSLEEKEYVQSISYFGYLYPGHESYLYYMAAQELIWERLSGAVIEWTNVLDKNGPRINIEQYKKEILDLQKWYYNKVELDVSEHSFYSIDSVETIYTKSGELDLYEIVDSGHVEAWTEGSILKIKTSPDYVGRNKIVLKKKGIYPRKSRFYYYDGSQCLVSVGNFLDDTVELSFSIVGKSLQFQVIDGETKMAIPVGQATFKGATYDIYNDNQEKIDQGVADENGRFVIDNLGYGNYFLKQVCESDGYLLNPDEFSVSFLGENDPVLLEEYPYYRNVNIYKKYNFENSGQLKEEENVTFEVVGDDGKSYGIVETNDKGIASIRLPYGLYTIYQRNTLFGYEKISPTAFSITEYSTQNMGIHFVDDYIVCKIKLLLFSEEKKKRIYQSGFSYKIFDLIKNKYLEVDSKYLFSTNENGELLFPMELGYGKYRIEEVNVSNGYLFQNQTFDIELNDDANLERVGKYLQYNLEVNEKVLMGNVLVSTLEEIFEVNNNGYFYKKSIRPNRKLNLFVQNDIYVDNDVLYHKGDEIDNIFTDGVGKKKIPLYLGDYCLLDGEINEKKCFSLKDSGNSTKNIDISLDFLKIIPRMNIFYHNESGEKEAIGGTTVDVINSSGKIIYTGITADDGNLLIENLPSGNYCFHQKKIDRKYFINYDQQCIEIDSSKKVWDIYAINKRSSTIVFLPDTLEKANNIGKGIIFILVIFFGGFAYKKIAIYCRR